MPEYQNDRQSDLLQHCISTVPAYQQMTSSNLTDWPVVNKNELRENKESHLQFVQKAETGYEMRIFAGSHYDKDELLEALHSIVGEKVNIKITPVDEIPILSSGKVRYIVNEMLK